MTLRAASQALLRKRFGKRYRRQISLINENTTRPPFGITTQDEQVTILALAGHNPNRAILVLNASDPNPDRNCVQACLQQSVSRCHEEGIEEIAFRCCSKKFAEATVHAWLFEGWTVPDNLHKYYRRNLLNVDSRLERFVLEFAEHPQLVPLAQVLENPQTLDQIPIVCTHEELRPTDDFEDEFSSAIEEDGQVIGWLVVSRRRNKLLYNRWFVDPKYRNVTQFWGARLVSHAVAKHLRLEPETAIELHVREHDERLASFYRRYLAPSCDRVESHWIASYEPKDC